MNTVLVATERDLEHNVLVQALDGQGFTIVRCRDGLDALEFARNKPPHVLLVNVALPKLDGFALYRRLQQDEQLRQIPIVLFSTRSNDVKSERFAQELGAVKFVGNALKPGALDGVLNAAMTAEPVPPLPRIPAAVIPLRPPIKPVEVRCAPPMATVSTPQVVVQSEPTLKLPALSDNTEMLQQLRNEQAQIRQALHAAQQQLDGAHTWQSMFTQSPVAMWVVAKQSQKMLAVNEATLRLFGYSQGEFMQLEGSNALRDPGQANTTNVFAFRSKDDRALSLLVNTRDLTFKTQAAELFVAHDVSYRVRGERAMAAEVQRVKAILATLPLAYWVIDAQGQLCDLNAAAGALLGCSREQMLEHGIAVLLEEASLKELQTLSAGQSLSLRLYQAGKALKVQFTAGQAEFGEGLRLLVLRMEDEDTVEMPVAQVPGASRLPVVLEMLRYADDADESTLLQYAMAQLAHAFGSPLAGFISVERITQTMDVVATSHTQARRRTAPVNNVAVPAAWRELLIPRNLCCSHEQQESLLVEGLPEISRYIACSAAKGRELWALVIANRDDPYSGIEQTEMQECADILVTLIGRMRQHTRLQAMANRSAAASDSMLGLLEKLLDRHDAYAAGSGARVASLAMGIARHMNLATERQHALTLAARLHDVGHLLIPQTLLLSPSVLSAPERTLLQSHVEQGVSLLNGVDMGADVASIVSQHHERLDGSGYPAALRADQIMLEARILAVADVMEAMCSARAYRPARTVSAALTELRAQAGHAYDAQVVAACEQVFATQDGRWPV